jgi:hypothetical protein
MINNLGKSLVLLQVALSVMLLALAVAIYFNAVDFGWEQPTRLWHEAKGGKGNNLLIPSMFDKREAAMRHLVRIKRDELTRVSNQQDNYVNVGTILAKNHLLGKEALDKLEGGEGDLDIKAVKYSEKGEMQRHPENPAELGFPELDAPMPGIKMSHASYQAKLKDLNSSIEQTQASTKELLNKEEAVTVRLSGKLDKDGKPAVDKSGAVIEPGWYYLLEKEYQTQRELLKELEYVEPLRVKEISDAQLALNRRDSLLRRLNELGDTGYLTQSEFLKKLR